MIPFLQTAGLMAIGLVFVAYLVSVGTPFMREIVPDRRGRKMWGVYIRGWFGPVLVGTYYSEASASKHVHDILQRRRDL
jgi:hypothetical protein